jgi:cAMP-dependent protein kinase regulator
MASSAVESTYEPVYIKKSAEETANIVEMCKPQFLFQGLDADQLDTVKDAMSKKSFKDGENMIVQGDVGKCMYLLISGEVDVTVQAMGDKVVASYKVGDTFGELALLYNAPRAATCKCRGDVEVWALDQLTFKHIVMDSTIKRRKENQNFFKDIPTFATLTEVEQLTIADALVTEKFTDGELVVKQGDMGDKFYIVRSGEAVCTQEVDGATVVVGRLMTGGYFGEIALLTSKPRQATVSAKGELVALSLDRATFTRVMGPLVDVLNRNIGTYTKKEEGANT